MKAVLEVFASVYEGQVSKISFIQQGYVNAIAKRNISKIDELFTFKTEDFPGYNAEEWA